MAIDKGTITRIFDMVVLHIRTRWLRTEERTNLEIEKSLIAGIPIYGTPDMTRVLFDRKYYVISKKEFTKLALINPVNLIPYKKEKFDCDNFARLFAETMALFTGINSVGVIIDHTGSHAYNVVIFKDGTLGFWEPQSDKWVEIGEKGSKYELGAGILIM